MASLTKYAGTISQTTGGKFAQFSNLNNLKNATEGSWATTANIKGKSGSPNRPSTLSFTGFSFGLPTGAEVSKVTITYRHRKTGSCTIGAPTISLLGVSGFSSKGVAPSKTTMATSTKTFTGSALTRTVVNSSSFGVKVDYPANSGTGEGTISVSYVRITVEYKVPSYTLSMKGTGGYNHEKYTIQASISNKNLTSYSPTCTLTAPTGFSFSSASGGSYTKVNARTITWNPQLSKSIGTASLDLEFDVNVTYPTGSSSYSGTFTLVESLYSGTESFSATITDRPSGEGTDVDPDEPLPDGGTAGIEQETVVEVVSGNEFKLELTEIINNSIEDKFANYMYELVFYNVESDNISYDGPNGDKSSSSTWTAYSFYNPNNIGGSTGHFPINGNWSMTDKGTHKVEIYRRIYLNQTWTGTTKVATFYINVIPQETDLTVPFFSILEPSEEEYNRLGDGYTYIAQADIKHTTTDTIGRDWYKNNRIGVFNGPVTNNTTEEDIFENTTYWSKATGGLNEYNNCECEFTYDNQYPLYILLTGDYPEATTYGYDMGTIKYDTPCIVEKQVYNGREATGNYPVPIEALLDNEEPSVITLAPNESTKGTILYDLPLEDDFGTNEDYAIRGIQVRADIDSTDNLVVYAKLHSPSGEIGQRSIILNGTEEEIIIGDLGDLWGFTTLQLTSLDDWELELSASNLLNNGDSEIVFNNVNITFYLETVEKQQIRVTIDGEDIAYYGAFIEKVDIPEGLETDTSFLTIDGTDTNDAYRQNIREKKITIEFNLNNCDLQTSTNMLRQLTKLFTNEKDQYNRPIPKRLQFTHYPTDYFEYIMEEPFDVTTEITDYNVKATLTIPSGTSYSLDDTVTNTVGNANGLAAINPIILFRPSDSNIQIKETLSEQSFQMGYSGNWQDYTVEIDCEDRRVYLIKDEDTKVDISKYVDHNSDWFRLSGEFEFEGINCTILTVTFNERW